MNTKEFTNLIKAKFPAVDIVTQSTTNGEQEFIVTDLTIKLQTKFEVTAEDNTVNRAQEVINLVDNTLEGVLQQARFVEGVKKSRPKAQKPARK